MKTKMNPTREPTMDEIKTLLNFLHVFNTANYDPIKEWVGGRDSSNSFTLPYPMYQTEVEQFFELASQEQWCDYDYNIALISIKIKAIKALKSATIPEIKTMLTFCVRGERFSDGHRAAMIEQGVITKLLLLLSKHLP
jgi:hypothetical protein